MLGIVEIRGNNKIMEEVAKLYCEIFSDSPWNENYILSEVLQTMDEHFKKPNAITLAALEDGKLIGFTWMYEIFKSDLREGTRFSPELHFLFNGIMRIFYLQELGIKKDLRRKGNGERLTQKLLNTGKENGANFVVLSTNPAAMAMISLISRIGFQNSGIVRPPKDLGRTYWFLELKKD